MQVQLLKDVVSSVVNPGSVGIIDLLYGKENVNEFIIAKKLKITINQARNILYKMADEGMVSFNRKKDKKNGGWYTYFWTLDTAKSLQVLREKITSELNGLNSQLASKQTKQFYYCPNDDTEMSEENALLHDFTCPECGEVFLAKDNSNQIKEIEDKVTSLYAKLELIDKELGGIRVKEEASRKRRDKAEERKKKAERDARRLERQKLKAKEAKKTGKTKPKKTSKPKKSTIKRSKKSTTKKKKEKVSPKNTKKIKKSTTKAIKKKTSLKRR